MSKGLEARRDGEEWKETLKTDVERRGWVCVRREVMKGDVVDEGWIDLAPLDLAPLEGLIRPPFFENIIEDNISSMLVEIGPEGWTPTQQPPEFSPSLSPLPLDYYFYLGEERKHES
jgi:hypothetical protein